MTGLATPERDGEASFLPGPARLVVPVRVPAAPLPSAPGGLQCRTRQTRPHGRPGRGRRGHSLVSAGAPDLVRMPCLVASPGGCAVVVVTLFANRRVEAGARNPHPHPLLNGWAVRAGAGQRARRCGLPVARGVARSRAACAVSSPVARRPSPAARDLPRLSASLPATASFSLRRRLLPHAIRLLSPTIAPSSCAIAISPHPPPPSHCSRSRHQRRAPSDSPPPETPDRCRQGLTSELSLLGPVSSSRDLTPSIHTPIHPSIHPPTLPDSLAPSSHHHPRLPALSRHPFSDLHTLCTPQTPFKLLATFSTNPHRA